MCKVSFSTLRNGTYVGSRLVGSDLQKVVFRWELPENQSATQYLYSADFFLNDVLHITIRGKIEPKESPCGKKTACRYFLDQANKTAPFPVELHATSPNTIAVKAFIEETGLPWELELSFQGSYFRKMRIRIAKMDTVPMPQPLRLEDFPDGLGMLHGSEPNFEMSLEHLFSRMGIALDISIHDLEERHFSFNFKAYRHCPEELLWDEKGLHQLMVDQFPSTDEETDWVANLLLLRGHYGTYGTYDIGTKSALRKTVGLMFDRQAGWQIASPSISRFFNAKPRQGAAIFWDPLLKKVGRHEAWYLQREFSFLMVHEIGHILNLRHAPSCFDLSYMNYPDFFCEGRDEFWQKFGFVFTDLEREHLFHGFLPEVVPGGKVSFPIIKQQTPSALDSHQISQPLFLASLSKPVYDPHEPVILECALTNPSDQSFSVPSLDPAFGDLTIMVTHPDGSTSVYLPPVYKCMVEKNQLEARDTHQHASVISISQDGFWLNDPGPYQLSIKLMQVEAEGVDHQASLSFSRREETANTLSDSLLTDRDAAHFLYFNGLDRATAKQSWLRFVEEQPHHPLCGLAHSALALGQLPICPKHPQRPEPRHLSANVKRHLAQAIEFGELPLSQRKSLIDIYEPEANEKSKKKGLTKRFSVWVTKLKRLFKKPNIQHFLGKHQMNLEIGKGREAQQLNATLTVTMPNADTPNQVAYSLTFPDRPQHNHEGSGHFHEGHRLEQPLVHLKGISPESGNEFELTLHFAISVFARKLYLTGKVGTGGGGGDGSVILSGGAGAPPPGSSGTGG